LKNLPEDGMAILNSDDERLLAFKDKLKSSVTLFGIEDNAEIKASDVSFNFNNFEPQGISFKLNYEGKFIPIRLPSVLAPHLIYSALSAVAVGIFFKINLVDIAGALENFVPPLGRMNLIDGLNGSYVIDDTYNSSPASCIAALDVVKSLKALRKIAVLGDMLELGEDSENGHKEVLTHALESGINIFFVAGDRMKKAAFELEKTGKLFGKVFYFDDPEALGLELERGLREGDLILVKGSQGMRMEKAVFEIMANQNEAEDLLCRQSKDWKKKPFVKP